MKRLLLAGTVLALSTPAMCDAFDPGFSKLPNIAYICQFHPYLPQFQQNITAAVAIHPAEGKVWWRNAQGTWTGKIVSGTRYGVGWFGGGLRINARDIRGGPLPDELTVVDRAKGNYQPCQRVSEAATSIDFEHAVLKQNFIPPPTPHSEAYSRCVSEMRTLNMTTNLMLYGGINQLMANITAYCSGVVGW
jgi:hypothetical protein